MAHYSRHQRDYLLCFQNLLITLENGSMLYVVVCRPLWLAVFHLGNINNNYRCAATGVVCRPLWLAVFPECM